MVFIMILGYPNKTECKSHLDDANNSNKHPKPVSLKEGKDAVKMRKSHLDDASTSNKHPKPVSLEERKDAVKMRSIKSYVSFMNGTELICCGVLHAYNRAIAATTCADKLKSRGLNNVTPVIGYSRGHNTQLLHIERVYELEEQTGLSFVFVSMLTLNLKHQE